MMGKSKALNCIGPLSRSLTQLFVCFCRMADTLWVLTCIFQACFAVASFFLWDGNTILAYFDMALVVITPFADWFYFIRYQENGVLKPYDIAVTSLLHGYMTARAWWATVAPGRTVFRDNPSRDGIVTH